MLNKEEYLMFICVLLHCIHQSNTDRDVFEEMKSAKEDGSLDSILVREAFTILLFSFVAVYCVCRNKVYSITAILIGEETSKKPPGL